MNDLYVLKILFEVRYPHAAALFDCRGKIANRWQGVSDLTEWQISNNQVVIHNKSNATLLRVGIRNAVTTMEFPESYEEFVGQASDFMADTLDKLDVQKLDRVGLRIIQIAERRQFKNLVTKMRKALFTMSGSQWNILGGPPDDIAFPLTLSIGEYRANFKIGPINKDQLMREYLESEAAKSQAPKTALCVDFDLYQSDLKWLPKMYPEKLQEYLIDSGDKIIKISGDFVNHHGGFE